MRAAFVFDQARCTGCEACRVACGIENGNGRDLGWRKVYTFNPAHHPALPTRHLSLACNHCERPACLLGCPAAAYRRDEKTGAVLLDSEKCLGCRYCSWVCPYDVPAFDAAAGVMRKCTFCVDRLTAGRAPACAQACPTGALSHAGRDAVSGEPELPGLPTIGLGPALITRPLPRPVSGVFETSPGGPGRQLQPFPARKIRLQAEWGLVVFTTVLPLLVAWFSSSLLGTPIEPPAFVLLAAGLLAMGTSALHLGKPSRAWRAILNLRTSWLSREILFSSIFVAAAPAALLLSRETTGAKAATLLAVLSGAGAVVAIDAVYRQIPSLERGLVRRRFDSAETWVTTLFLTGLFANSPWLWLPPALLKAAHLIRRETLASAPGIETPETLQRVRTLLLILASLVAAASEGSWIGTALAVVLALSGEVLDRCRFYLELEPVSPARLLAQAAVA